MFSHLLSSGEAKLGIFCLVLGSWYKREMDILDRIQERATEMVKGLEERLKELGLLRDFCFKQI